MRSSEFQDESETASLQEMVLNAISNAVVVVDGSNQILFANQAAENFFGMSASNMAKQRLEDMLPKASPLLSLIAQSRRSGAAVSEYEVDIGSPKTGPHLTDVQVSPLGEGDSRCFVHLQERSMAQKMDRQLIHRGAARSVSAMSAILAHEIKNPLAGIRGAAQLIEQNAGAADRALTQLICEETDRIRKLVDRMEIFGDSRRIERHPVNIHQVLDHVRRIAEASFAKGIRFVESYDPSLPPIPGDRDQLIQVFLNLTKNAADAIAEGPAPDDGEIVFSTSYRPGVRLSVPGSGERIGLPLEVRVRDNGVGVSRDMEPYLFDPFVTTKRTGTGLGLALVAKIVGDHGGVIECIGEPRRTVFRVLLPWQADQKAV
ncbi:Sensory histidine kinase/phosphatase NtrB [Alphaproteobacteria bacterium SO-S41]|nr:Sensory histidine kinase/phosphatase NtrB [Alphaproteobacteria bacterium SO-S41]